MLKNFRAKRRKIFIFNSDYRFAYSDAILHISKHSYEQKTIEVDWNKMHTYVSKFKYIVTVDLWFFLARYEWVGKEQNAKVEV